MNDSKSATAHIFTVPIKNVRLFVSSTVWESTALTFRGHPRHLIAGSCTVGGILAFPASLGSFNRQSFPAPAVRFGQKETVVCPAGHELHSISRFALSSSKYIWLICCVSPSLPVGVGAISGITLYFQKCSSSAMRLSKTALSLIIL